MPHSLSPVTRVATVTVLLVATGMIAAIVSPPIARDVHAQDVIIYRCTDADGAVTLQNNAPCPKGMKQEVRVLGGVPTMPAPSVPASTPSAPKPAPAANASVAGADAGKDGIVAPGRPSAGADAPPRLSPPPPLFQCRTWDGRDYLGDVAEPPASCVPIDTIGIDGSPTLAAGEACEMRRDDCSAIPGEQLCEAWGRRVAEAEFRWKYAGSRNDERRTEFERLTRIYHGSTCQL